MTINYYARCGYRFLLFLLHRNREDDAHCPSVRPLPFVGIPIPRPLAHDTARVEWLGPWLAQLELDDGNAEKHR